VNRFFTSKDAIILLGLFILRISMNSFVDFMLYWFGIYGVMISLMRFERSYVGVGIVDIMGLNGGSL
jgi:hypothetical protein